MPTVTLTLPTAATVITAGLHANNYTILQTFLNGGLDTANWASGKIFAPSKLMQEAATAKDGLLWNAAAAIWEPKGVAGVYDRVTATADIQNTAAETSIYTKSIVGGDMGTSKGLRLTMSGDYLHNNGAGDAIAFRVKFGGSTLWQPANFTLGGTASAIRHPWIWTVLLENVGAANSQQLAVKLEGAATTEAAPTTGIGNLTNAFVGYGGNAGLSAIDTASAQTLDVTVQWSAASANNSWRLRKATLELV